MERQQFDLNVSEEGITKSPRKPKEPKKSAYSPWYYLGAFGNIGVSVAGPIVVGAIIGSLIDTKFGSKPTATLGGIVLGLIISIVGFIQMIRKILRGDYNPK